MMAPAQPSWSAMPAAARGDDTAARTVPFDYSFQFKLNGEPGHSSRRKVTVSVEASFTAVSIGYGVVPEVTPLIFGPVPLTTSLANTLAKVAPPAFSASLAPAIQALRADGPAALSVALRDITLGDLMDALDVAIAGAPDVPKGMPPLEAALRNGFKLNADLVRLAMAGNGNAVLEGSSLQKLFQVVSAPVADVRFLYALADEGSGREFQSEPILNVAGLGASDGRRPFRHFAQPISFAPLATIRMDITEQSDFRGELHVALHGYKVLGGAGTPTDTQGRGTRRDGRQGRA